MDLTGWTLFDDTSSSMGVLSGTLEAGDYLVVEVSNRLNVAGDSIRLSTSTLTDDVFVEVSYGSGADVEAPGSGEFAFRDSAGDWHIVDFNTKGSANVEIKNGSIYYPTIQAAIDVAISGDTINVAAGTYVEDLIINKEVSLVGIGSVTIDGNHRIEADNVVVDGFTLDLSTSLDGEVGFFLTDVSGVEITNNVFNGPSNQNCNPWKIGGSFGNPIGYNVSNFLFEGNTVNKCSIPINLQNNALDGITINNNVFRDTDGVVYVWTQDGSTPTGVLSNFVFTNNDIDSTNTYGVAFFDSDMDEDDFTDSNFGDGNNIENNKFVGIIGNYGLKSVSILANLTSYTLDVTNNWWGVVNPDFGTLVSSNVDYTPWCENEACSSTRSFNVSINGNTESGFLTINDAIASAVPGDTINVEAGTYTYATEISPGNGMIVINKGLTLKAADGARPVLDGSGDDGVIKVWPAALEDGFPVVIEGFEITGNAVTSTAITGRMYTTATDALTIRNNIIHGMIAGINFWGSSGGRLKNIEITDNKFYDLGEEGVTQGYGVWLEGLADRATIGDVYAATVEQNEFYSIYDGTGINYGFGIKAQDGAANMNIADNSFATVSIGIALISADVTNTRIVSNDINTAVLGVMTQDITNGPVDAENNWWGDTVPLDNVSSGVDVDFDPYYVNVEMTILSSDVSGDTVTAPSGDGDLVLSWGNEGEVDLPDGVTDVVLDNDSGLDLSAGLEDNAVTLQSGDQDAPVVLTNSDLPDFSVSIPDGTLITGPIGIIWDGIITPPTDVESEGTAPSGFSVGDTVIFVGSSQGTLTFSVPVTLLLPNVIGTVGYKPALSDTWVQITNTCGGDYITPTFVSNECSINNGTNTKILTNHFTEFGELDPIPTPPAPPAPPRSSRSGSFSPAARAAILAANPNASPVSVVGQVLGAFTEAERQAQIATVRTSLISLIKQLIGLLQEQLATAIQAQGDN